MPGFHAEAHIAAPPERVWALLIHFEDYPSWTRALALSGKPEANAAIDYVVPFARPAGPIRRLSLPCEITHLAPGRRLALTFGWAGIVRYELSFELERDGDGSRLRHGIEAQGLLGRMIGGRLQRLLKRPFETFVNDARRRLEGPGPTKPKPKLSRAGKSRVPRNLPPPKRARHR
ncbi:MAG TPA: SRPBCC family protein [Phenylobacterium sp.]